MFLVKTTMLILLVKLNIKNILSPIIIIFSLSLKNLYVVILTIRKNYVRGHISKLLLMSEKYYFIYIYIC